MDQIPFDTTPLQVPFGLTNIEENEEKEVNEK